MFVHAAQSMGYRTAVLDPDPLSPAGLVAHEHIRAAYLDPLALDRLGERCAAITTEFENVPAAALAALAQRRPVAPSAAAVSMCQDRGAEKAAFARSGVACAPHASIASAPDVERVAGILAVTRVPARPHVADSARAEAIALATRLAGALDYVGVLCVEFFILADGSLVANEMAPRPHNSGHYSLDACDVSQFELQVRAMTGAPLAAPRLHSPCVMINLLGDLWRDGQAPDWRDVLALPGAHLHLYSKEEARPGRKMGHLTLTAATSAEAEARAADAARQLGLAAAPGVAATGLATAVGPAAL